MPNKKPDRRMSSGRKKTQDGNTHTTTRGADWAPAYLVALATTGHCGNAAIAAQIDYSTVWRRRKSDPDFAKDYDEALGIAANLLEAEAVRRARDGLRQYKFHPKTGEPLIHPETGQPYFEHTYSDTLLTALLKRFFPKEYRERQEIEHSGQIGMTLEEFRKRVEEAAK